LRRSPLITTGGPGTVGHGHRGQHWIDTEAQ
jgi:hypothetical protein